jgi:hypothetical protein
MMATTFILEELQERAAASCILQHILAIASIMVLECSSMVDFANGVK